MASKKDCEAREVVWGAPSPSTSEGRKITGFPRVHLVQEGLFNRIHIDFNDMTGLDASKYPDGLRLPKGVSFGEWQVAKRFAPSCFGEMKAELERVEAQKKAKK